MVESDTSSSITQVYGDTSTFTNLDLWLSGWQDGVKFNPSKPISRKVFTPCTQMNAWIYPFFIVQELLLWWLPKCPGCITSGFYELYLIPLISPRRLWPFHSSNNIPSYLQTFWESWDSRWMVRKSWVQIWFSFNFLTDKIRLILLIT